MEEFKFKFSIVIPCYNVARYLDEAVESIINQSIGFRKNIQIILVNDGSRDNTEEICIRYRDMYPENIVYVKKENGGVSSARNTGIQYVEGKYVNFLDGDDKWEQDALEKIYDFFEEKYEFVDIVVARKQFFEALDGYHTLDYKFKKTKVVDVFEDYNFVQMDVTSSFFKSDVVKNYRFNTNLKYAEDSEFLNRIMLEKHKFGVVREALHLYRKRLDETSALQKEESSKSWYTDTLQLYHNEMIKYSINKFGKVIQYVQFLIMYDIQWRVKKNSFKALNEEEKKKYIKNIISLLQNIEDYIILEQKNISTAHKFFTLSLKYGKDIRKDLFYKKGKLYFNNIKAYNIRKNTSIIKVDIIEINNNNLYIEGRIETPLERDIFDIYLYINAEERKLLELKEGTPALYNKNTLTFGDNKIINHYTFKVEIPLANINKISFLFMYNNEFANKLPLKFGKFSKISGKEKSYYTKGEYILRYKNKNITVRIKRRFSIAKAELKYAKSLIEEGKKDIAFTRFMYFVYKKFCKKDIWLISDRENKANDNGEHLFKYIQTVKNKKINPYFLISKDSEDYRKMRKIGKVINANSLKHKIYFLLATQIISSQANDYVTNAFEKNEVYYRDLMSYKFAFLQHGVTKDDLSKWLKKLDKNIKMFVTVGKPEYNSIVNGNYGYTENEVKLTGFPRHDNLMRMSKKNNEKEKKILIVPTWRKTIKGSYIEKTGESIYLDTFKNTEYFKFYNNLINDKRVIEALKNNGYKCKFCLHPSHYRQYVDFQGNEYVEINEGFVDYQKEFTTASLMVTDYSSVFFDFAYLKKPIIYSQFDEKDFFSGGHAYEKGYFDYTDNGFGPVCFDYETTVQELVKAINNDCKLEEKYKKRIESFYQYHDENNCKRVYEELLKI